MPYGLAELVRVALKNIFGYYPKEVVLCNEIGIECITDVEIRIPPVNTSHSFQGTLHFQDSCTIPVLLDYLFRKK